MCGIIGMNGREEETVRNAAMLFAYRGPDAFGISSDEHVTLGHNRLSIIDPESRSDQPMWDESHTLCIVFNGEIYNFKELRKELQEAHGAIFRTESDTEVLLFAYKAWGAGMVTRLEGMYALAFYDTDAGKILLYTDHSAIKPLFYTSHDGVFAFASELKGIVKILKDKGLPPTVDREALGLYFALGYVPAPRTIYEGVHRLLPHTCAVFDIAKKTISIERTEPKPAIALNEGELQGLIERKIQAHLIADVPVGVFFSGGTDSSLIASVLHKLGTDLETFSVRVAGRDEDRKYFDPIAAHLNLKTNVFDFGAAEFDDVYPEVVAKLDEPLYDNSLFPTYFIAREAAKRVKVVLSGEGGDEYFFGYPRSLSLNSIMPRALDTKVGILERLFLLLPNFRGKNRLFEKIFIACGDSAAFYLLTMSPAKGSLSLKDWTRAKEVLCTSHSSREFDADWYLPNDLLRKLDRATMYCSLEGRVPLLDADIIAAARALPAPERGSKMLKPVLKKILTAYLPPELIYRKKSGFGLSALMFDESIYLKPDLQKAVSYLKERSLMPLSGMPAVEDLPARNPALAFACISLYHALSNAERI